MELPSTITGTWLIVGIAVALLVAIFTTTWYGVVIGVLLVAVVWYILYVLGYRTHKLATGENRGRWREGK